MDGSQNAYVTGSMWMPPCCCKRGDLGPLQTRRKFSPVLDLPPPLFARSLSLFCTLNIVFLSLSTMRTERVHGWTPESRRDCLDVLVTLFPLGRGSWGPVVAMDGFTYERSAITTWFQRHNTSPMTRAVILPNVVPNLDKRSEIANWE